jgi:fermentation-respiration switch protein FrsA (DUF1100 family)
MSNKAQLQRQLPHWWWRMLRSLGLALGISVMLLTVMGMSFGDRFIFFPSRANEEWDRHRRMTGAEEVTFPAADGAQLVSWYLRATSARATVLFFHGNAGNLSHRTDILQTLAGLDADVFIVGYHGYGKSAGEPSEANLYLDADAAYAYLTEQRGVPPSRLVVFGESLGGGPAIDLALRKPCAGLVIQSSFTSIGDMASHTLPFFPTGWLIRSKFDNLAKIPQIGVPKLFFATRADEVVPYKQTRRLFEAAAEPKTWVEFDGCGHNDLFWKKHREWVAAVRQFLDDVAPQR